MQIKVIEIDIPDGLALHAFAVRGQGAVLGISEHGQRADQSSVIFTMPEAETERLTRAAEAFNAIMAGR
jgi:hypothetical protein